MRDRYLCQKHQSIWCTTKLNFDFLLRLLSKKTAPKVLAISQQSLMGYDPIRLSNICVSVYSLDSGDIKLVDTRRMSYVTPVFYQCVQPSLLVGGYIFECLQQANWMFIMTTEMRLLFSLDDRDDICKFHMTTPTLPLA